MSPSASASPDRSREDRSIQSLPCRAAITGTVSHPNVLEFLPRDLAKRHLIARNQRKWPLGCGTETPKRRLSDMSPASRRRIAIYEQLTNGSDQSAAWNPLIETCHARDVPVFGKLAHIWLTGRKPDGQHTQPGLCDILPGLLNPKPSAASRLLKLRPIAAADHRRNAPEGSSLRKWLSQPIPRSQQSGKPVIQQIVTEPKRVETHEYR